MNRGDIWWCELPQLGRRPGCIITRQTAIPVLHDLLVVPATRTMRGIPTEVRLGPEDGMPVECALTLDSLLPVPKGMIVERITRLGPAKLGELCTALAIATGCR